MDLLIYLMSIVMLTFLFKWNEIYNGYVFIGGEAIS